MLWLLALLIIVAILWLSVVIVMPRLEFFESAPIVVTQNRMNYEGWAKKNGYALRSVDAKGWKEISSKEIKPDAENQLFIVSPLERDSNGFQAATSAPRLQSGYFWRFFPAASAKAAIGNVKNWVGDSVAVLTDWDAALIKTILYGYRIDPKSVRIDVLELRDLENLGTVLLRYTGGLVTFVVKDSALHRQLQKQSLVAVGWKDIDLDRLRITYPYLEKEGVDEYSWWPSNAPAGDGSGDVLKMTPVLASSATGIAENFAVRFQFSPENEDPTYRCYGNDKLTHSLSCDSAYDAYGNRKEQPNYWDRPCRTNEECPFYSAASGNGGCIGGICEWPVGVKGLTDRKPDDGTPFCKGPCSPTTILFPKTVSPQNYIALK